MSRYVAVLSVLVAAVYGFQLPAHNTNNSLGTVLLSESGGTNRDREIENRDTKNDDFLSQIPNPFRELSEMFQYFDDVLDDFFYKRMGNGEVFNGKRKYKPSGRPNTEGKYNGMGLSDKLRIDVTRETKEEMLERRRLQREQQKRK